MHVPYVNSDSREKCIEFIFQYCFQKSSEKCIGSPNPLFYRCNLFHYEKQYTFSKNSNETRRNWGRLAAPDFANSGKKHVLFLCSRSGSRHCRRPCRRRCQKTMPEDDAEDDDGDGDDDVDDVDDVDEA